MLLTSNQLILNKKNFTKLSTKIVLFFLVLISVTGVSGQNSDLPALTPKQIAQRTLPSIVILVMNNGDNNPITTGSGFFVTEDTIVTNYHVVRNAVLGAVKIYGGDEVYSIIGTVGVDPTNDVALLKIKGVKGKPLKLNGTSQLSIGDEIFTVSSPKGLEGTFSQGLISSLRKSSSKDLIQISAAISHGSSGGAILNNQAEVIAVAVGGIDEGQSLNFAVPIKYAQALMSKNIALANLPGKKDKSNESRYIFPSEKGVNGSGGGEGRDLNSPKNQVKSPPLFVTETAIKAPSSVAEIIKTRIPPPVLKPNQFKVPDLFEDNSRGDVSEIVTTTYNITPNLDKFIKGNKQSQYKEFYNRDGNLTDIISASDFLLSNGLRLPSEGSKILKTYNSSNRTVAVEEYEYEKFSSKTITTYNSNGEKLTTLYYTEKGDLEIKETFEYSNIFSKHSDCSIDECDTTYTGLDDNGIEISINYNSKNLPSLIHKRVKKNDLITKDISYNFCHKNGSEEKYHQNKCAYDGKMSGITVTIFSYDSSTNQLISKIIQTRDLDNPNKPVETESYKYEYKYDSRGNWIEKIEKKEVVKFGETYFEPITFRERQIKYYSDSDAKSLNKGANANRKKN